MKTINCYIFDHDDSALTILTMKKFLNLEEKNIFERGVYQTQNGAVQLVPNMDAPVTTEEIQTTMIVSEGTDETLSKTVKGKKYTEIPSALNDFFRIPRYDSDVLWTSTTGGGAQPAGTQLYTNTAASFLAANADLTNKLYGRNLMRAKFGIKVMLNSNPFQQGRLIVCWAPCNSTKMIANRVLNLATITQLPHVEMGTSDTEVCLEMPYIAPTRYYDIFADQFDWGDFFIFVLSPLKVGAAATILDAELSVFLYFDDLELAAPLVPNARMGKAIQEREAHAIATMGTVSGGLRTVSTIAGALSNIPALAAYCAPTMWACDKLAGIASQFGYSKPMNESAPAPVVRQFFRAAATADGDDPSQPLGLLSNNRLRGIEDTTINPVDEMSFEFLKKVECFNSSVNWTTSSTGTLYTKNITPKTLYSVGTYPSASLTCTYHTGPPIWYLAGGFQLWRGSVKVRIKIVKNQFQTGRLVFLWQPGPNTYSVPSLTNQTYCLREIIDIRFEDELEMELPWLCAPDYLPMSETSGTFSISVLNELRAPDTVPLNVDILLFFSGGRDFELAVPVVGSGSNYVPLLVGNANLSGGVIADTGSNDLGLLPAEECIGEAFTSVKQLTNRLSRIAVPTDIASGNLWINPWFTSGITTASGNLSSTTTPGGDTIGRIAPMYNFMRGSLRLTVQNQNAAPAWQSVSLEATNLHTNWIAVGDGWPYSGWSWMTPSAGVTAFTGTILPDFNMNTVSVVVPYYNTVRCTRVQMNVSISAANVDASAPSVGVNFCGTVASAIYRSTCDDFQFSYFLGCPPIFVSLA
jgi:hypothetical protein